MSEGPLDAAPPTLAQVDAELARVPARASGAGQGLALLVVSLVLFVGAQGTLIEAPWTFLALLVAVLAVHELGHLAAMRAFGYRDLRMFFIPFFGAAAAGKKPDATGTQRALVALAGPLPGIVLGVVGLVASALWRDEMTPIEAQLVGLLLVLNFFNLLPIVPFDGGRFVSIVLFSRWPGVERAFRLLASAALVWFAVQAGSWLLGLIGAFIALTSGIHATYARLGRRLREQVPPPRPASILDLPAAVRLDGIAALAPILGARGTPEQRARDYARGLTGVWNRALDAPPGPLASVLLLLLYGAFVALGLVLYFGVPDA